MREMHVGMGMDWLGQQHSLINCDKKQVCTQNPSGGELIIHGERRKNSQLFVQQQGHKSTDNTYVCGFWFI